VFVSVDILRRSKKEWQLIEVKSTSSVKEEHLPDVAVQLYVLRTAGLPVETVELMHLNRDCHFPDLSTLFVREDVTGQLDPYLDQVPGEIEAQRAMLGRGLPKVDIGPHCFDREECPFRARCWPKLARHNVFTLYYVPAKTQWQLFGEGVRDVTRVPATVKLKEITRRQCRAVRQKKMIVEDGLAQALSPFEAPLAFLDFETISPAIPCWNGCTPYQQVPVQFSCHAQGAGGRVQHHEWLADGADDPRAALAKALIEACAGAKTIIAYNAGFERTVIEALAAALPRLATPLRGIAERLADLLPVVRDYVYHPDFLGSFSLKSVAPALLDGLAYDDLEIAQGGAAAQVLETLLLRAETFSQKEQGELRTQLLAYCSRDTEVLVALWDKLRTIQ
jgi:hypothetical protein